MIMSNALVSAALNLRGLVLECYSTVETCGRQSVRPAEVYCNRAILGG